VLNEWDDESSDEAAAILRDGDELLIPSKTKEITILGEVQGAVSHAFEAMRPYGDRVHGR
jgi:hypothetical protein